MKTENLIWLVLIGAAALALYRAFKPGAKVAAAPKSGQPAQPPANPEQWPLLIFQTANAMLKPPTSLDPELVKTGETLPDWGAY